MRCSTLGPLWLIGKVIVLFVGVISSEAKASPPPIPHELGYPNVIPPTSQFGHYGSKPGELNEPLAVAIDAEGEIYITDTFNNRINVYSSEGKFLRSWGSLGRADGELKFPQAIAVTRTGLVYVADTGNNRIVVFDKLGKHIRSWGKLGADVGQFNEPIGVAAWSGRVAVADRANERVQVFSSTGDYLWSVGEFGREAGQFDYPSDVAFDADGNLYVADSYNNRIQKLDSNGKVLRHWGGWGSYSGLLANPSGLAVLGQKVFVTDLINHRIQVFGPNGEYLYQWGRHPPTGHEGNGRLHYPSRLAVSDRGLVVVCEPFEYRCQVFSETSFARVVNVDDKAWWEKAGRFHYGARVATHGRLLTIAEPDTHSVLVFDISKDEPLFVTRVGNQGRDLGSFIRPSGMAINDETGEILVSDGGNHRLQLFALTKGATEFPSIFAANQSRALVARSVVALGVPETSTQGFRGISAKGYDGSGSSPVEPGAIRTGPDGNYYIADPHNARILILDKKLDLIRSFGRRGQGLGELLVPNDLSFSKDGETIYIVDTYNFRIVAFSLKGEYKFEWGTAGPGEEQFIHPFGIASGHDGFVYVSDDAANRVQKFDENGKFVKSWGRWGTEPGQFYKPKGIVQDARGRLIIADFGNHRAQIMDTEGKYLGMFGIGEGYTPPMAMLAEFQGWDRNSADSVVAPLLSNGGMYLVSWKPRQGVVPLNQLFDMDVKIVAANNHEPADGVQLKVSAVMPAHYHGMNVAPTITKNGSGNWLVSGMLLHMPGSWQIAFDIDNGIVVERTQSDVEPK